MEAKINSATEDELAYIRCVFHSDSEAILLIVFFLALASDSDIGRIKPTIAIGSVLDSLDIVEFIIMLEERYSTDIPVRELEKLRTIGDVTEYCKKFKIKQGDTNEQ